MPIRPQILYVFRVSLCAALLSLCCSAAMSQSGRRVRKPVLDPVPAAEPTPTPKPSEKPKPRLSFIVGMDRNGAFANLSMAVYDGALRSCAERLDAPESVKVEIATREMGRSEAITRAKAEKEAFVVLLEIRLDTVGVDRSTGSSNTTGWIEYVVFAPLTGKLVTSGQTYRGDRNKGILGRRTPNIYGDYALNQAAQEAADRILDAFKIHSPSGRFP